MKKYLLLCLFFSQFIVAQERVAGRFDNGKMWTFDNPPLAYFQEEYGFQPDSNWFKKAQLGALRFATYCSASFVSPNGLVMTNHHCARESVAKVSAGKGLIENGFAAKTLLQEKKVDSLFVEQLIKIEDITTTVKELLVAQEDEMQTISQLETQLSANVAKNQRVQVIRLYDGGQYAAYTFRKFEDVRLVMAPELQLGFYGGDADNFTYPRYCLDMSFFRVYENGRPYKPEAYFPFSANGAKENEAVFVVGNPGSTSRSQTVAQLEYRRDYETKASALLFNQRLPILKQYLDFNDEEAANEYFEYTNSAKSIDGQLAGLNNTIYMDRRKDAEAKFVLALDENGMLKNKYAGLLQELADNKTEQGAYGAFLVATYGIVAPDLAVISAFERRMFFAGVYQVYKDFGQSARSYNQFKETVLSVADQDSALDKALFTVRITDILRELAEYHPVKQKLLALANGENNPAQIAELLISRSQLSSKTKAAAAFAPNTTGDVGMVLGKEIAKAYIEMQRETSDLAEEEAKLLAEIAQARFAVFGKLAPPDATFSLRISDGRIKGYAYNGTIAPAFTTFYGLYERHFAHLGKKEWELPSKWLNAPSSFNKATQMNFVSTNDIIGGNSGSPILNQNLEVVGLVFDGNIESLPGEFIYESTYNRTISTDSRAIIASIDHIYDLDRLAKELQTGKLFSTELEADRPVARTPQRSVRTN